MIVMKFGGATTHSADGIRGVVRLVAEHRAMRPVVVVSAIDKTTRAIDHAAQLASHGRIAEADAACAELIAWHRTLACETSDGSQRDAALARIDEIGARLRTVIEGVSIMKELSDRSRDACLALGEPLAAAILTAALPDSVYVPASSVMITDRRFGHAEPQLDIVGARVATSIAPAASAGKIVVIEGFVGATPEGIPTTMGWESSDFSATLIGAALAAGEVQIWTNVSGVMSVDPDRCASARTIAALSYDEAEELAALGAKVLHPRTIGPARMANVPISVRNAGDPRGACTTINDTPSTNGVKAIAIARDLGRQIDGASDESVFALAVPSGRAVFSSLSEQGDSAAISLVGEGVGRDAALLQSALTALAGSNIRAVIFGASPRSFSVIVDARDVQRAVNEVHRTLIEER